jgi:hypothetical protein
LAGGSAGALIGSSSSLLLLLRPLSAGPHIEPQQHFVVIGQVPDHPPERRRQLLDQGRRGQDPVVLGQLRVLENVDDLELVAALELLLAEVPEVGDGALGARRPAGDIELQQVAIQVVLPFVQRSR